MTITLYTAEEVSEQNLLPYKPRVLKEKARLGTIGHVRIGRKIRFTEEHIRAAIAAGDKPLAEPKPARNPRKTYAS